LVEQNSKENSKSNFIVWHRQLLHQLSRHKIQKKIARLEKRQVLSKVSVQTKFKRK